MPLRSGASSRRLALTLGLADGLFSRKTAGSFVRGFAFLIKKPVKYDGLHFDLVILTLIIVCDRLDYRANIDWGITVFIN